MAKKKQKCNFRYFLSVGDGDDVVELTEQQAEEMQAKEPDLEVEELDEDEVELEDVEVGGVDTDDSDMDKDDEDEEDVADEDEDEANDEGILAECFFECGDWTSISFATIEECEQYILDRISR